MAENNQGEMSFIDHLEELRWHLMRSIIAIGSIMVLVFVSGQFIFEYIILAPKGVDFLSYRMLCKFSNAVGLGEAACMVPREFQIINTDMTGQFMAHLQIALVLGFIFAFPYVFWEVWRFVKPALHENEKTYTRGIVVATSILFAIGAAFGYYVLLPLSINFFVTYSVSPEVVNTITLMSYVSFISTLVMVSAIMFELPMVVYILAKLGLITPDLMRQYRRYAFVTILLIAAIITPADVWTQVLVTIPVYFLYEMSIWVCASVVRKQLAEEKALEKIGD